MDVDLKQVAREVRKSILTQVFTAKSGHPGGSLSATEILTYLYFKEMHIDPTKPNCCCRDRFVLSKGHVTPALYGVLAERGFFPKEELKTFRALNSRLQGHPNMNDTPGVDMSTGSLGQGVSTAVGMALAGKKFNKDYRVYALLGDGEIEEGQVWEAAMFAGNHQLDNLTLIVDNNNLQLDGTLEQINTPQPIGEKFKAFLEENDLSFFDDPQSFDDEYHTTRFNSRIEAKGQIMPMAIFIDDSIFTIIRTNVAAGINVKNVDRIKNYLNALNAEYKIFKYYLREDGSIYLDVCVPSVAETFDGIMIRTLLGIIVKHLEDVYEDLMAEVWAKD